MSEIWAPQFDLSLNFENKQKGTAGLLLLFDVGPGLLHWAGKHALAWAAGGDSAQCLLAHEPLRQQDVNRTKSVPPLLYSSPWRTTELMLRGVVVEEPLLQGGGNDPRVELHRF
jgi:hypothetical protein